MYVVVGCGMLGGFACVPLCIVHGLASLLFRINIHVLIACNWHTRACVFLYVSFRLSAVSLGIFSTNIARVNMLFVVFLPGPVLCFVHLIHPRTIGCLCVFFFAMCSVEIGMPYVFAFVFVFVFTFLTWILLLLLLLRRRLRHVNESYVYYDRYVTDGTGFDWIDHNLDLHNFN
jgi:hypothetical protein